MTKEILYPLLEKESVSGYRSLSLVSEFYNKRTIFIQGEIDDAALYKFTQEFVLLQEESEKPINILLNTPGGSVIAGLGIYDLIQGSSVPVNVYCIGMAASMGALILASGSKGRRYILPHSKVMIHEPLLSNGIGGSASSIKNTADSILKTREVLNRILSKHTGKTLREINKATEFDNYMNAEQAIKFGLCDEVVEKICFGGLKNE